MTHPRAHIDLIASNWRRCMGNLRERVEKHKRIAASYIFVNKLLRGTMFVCSGTSIFGLKYDQPVILTVTLSIGTFILSGIVLCDMYNKLYHEQKIVRYNCYIDRCSFELKECYRVISKFSSQRAHLHSYYDVDTEELKNYNEELDAKWRSATYRLNNIYGFWRKNTYEKQDELRFLHPIDSPKTSSLRIISPSRIRWEDKVMIKRSNSMEAMNRPLLD